MSSIEFVEFDMARDCGLILPLAHTHSGHTAS